MTVADKTIRIAGHNGKVREYMLSFSEHPDRRTVRNQLVNLKEKILNSFRVKGLRLETLGLYRVVEMCLPGIPFSKTKNLIYC